MRRALIVLLLVPAIAAVTGLQSAAIAAPTKSPGAVELTHPCGDAIVTELLVPGLGLKSWGVDASGELDGREFILKSTGLRAYVGNLPSEPADQDPVFTSRKTFGKRVGQGDALSCTNRDTFTDEEGQIFTVFFDIELVQLKP